MRPNAVVLAEYIYLASVVLLCAVTAITWDATVAQVGFAAVAGVTAFSIGLSLLLLLLATRARSRVALWLLAVLTAIGVAGVLIQVAQGALAAGLVGVLTVLQLLATVVPIVLLFRPHARAWFAAHRETDREDIA